MTDAVPDINSGDTPRWRVLDRYRELELQLNLFSQHLSARVGLRPVELQAFNLVHRHGALTIGELARMLALPPATTTGIVDRLADRGWVTRDRSESDRRTVLVRALPDHLGELFGHLAGLGEDLDAAMEGLDDETLRTLAEFLDRAAASTHAATDRLR